MERAENRNPALRFPLRRCRLRDPFIVDIDPEDIGVIHFFPGVAAIEHPSGFEHLADYLNRN
jgi:hypothetical protein